MQIKRSVIFNFMGGGWNAVLILLTTPWFVAQLGLEGFGLVAFWQLLFYLSLVLDFGLGTAFARELSRYIGIDARRREFRLLLAVFERPILLLAAGMLVLIFTAAPLIAGYWLKVSSLALADVTLAVRLMAVSVAGQFVLAVYAYALGGLQKQGTMNALQMVAGSLRYLGGAMVLALGGGVREFFIYQGVVAVGLAVGGRVVLLGRIAGLPAGTADAGAAPLRRFMAFSGGIFFTALCGALVSNADRLAVSKMLPAEALGKYSIAVTAVGLLQMSIFAFHRAYFPKFAELNAAGNMAVLRRTYYQGCMLVGLTIIPMAAVFVFFTPELFTIWLGWSDAEAVEVSRLLIVGFAMAGVMWIPAAYQQAIGWTRLHALLMLATLIVGVPVLVWAIGRFGLVGASSLVLVHGVIELTFGLWLMNRVCFPGENLLWYGRVVIAPMLASAPLVALSWALLPPLTDKLQLVAWIGATSVVTSVVVAAVGLGLLRHLRDRA